MRRSWTDVERSVVRHRYPDERCADVARDLGRTCSQVYQMAHSLGLHKSAKFMASDRSGRVQRGKRDPRMVGTQFKPGHATWNKGTHFAPAGSEKGWFKKGQLSGAAKAKELPVGSERVSHGVLLRKMGTCLNRWTRWQPVHRTTWEAANGPVPRGCIVVFKPGRHTTNAREITLDRLECITRVENMRRNSRHTNYPPEVNQLMQLRGALKRKINNRSEHEEQND